MAAVAAPPAAPAPAAAVAAAAQQAQLLPPVAAASVAPQKKNTDARNVFIGTACIVIGALSFAVEKCSNSDSFEAGAAWAVTRISGVAAAIFAGGVVCRGIKDGCRVIKDGYNRCIKKLKTRIKPLKGDACVYSIFGGIGGGAAGLAYKWYFTSTLGLTGPIAGGALALNLFGCLGGMSWVNPDSGKQN